MPQPRSSNMKSNAAGLGVFALQREKRPIPRRFVNRLGRPGDRAARGLRRARGLVAGDHGVDLEDVVRAARTRLLDLAYEQIAHELVIALAIADLVRRQG